MTSKLTGFSPRSARRVAGVWTVFVLASAGWALGGQLGAVMAVVVGVALVFVQWWGQPAWSWAVLGLRGRRPVKWNDPITLANNRSGGGVRVQDGVAVVGGATSRPSAPGDYGHRVGDRRKRQRD